MQHLPYHLPGLSDADGPKDLATLARLVRDLRSYAGEEGPTEEQIAAAPVLSAWFPMTDASACRFAGLIDGHPLVRPGPGMSSRVYAVDRSYRWMRSHSRLWRLGPPAKMAELGRPD